MNIMLINKKSCSEMLKLDNTQLGKLARNLIEIIFQEKSDVIPLDTSLITTIKKESKSFEKESK